VSALQGEAGGVRLADLAREAVEIASAGLKARGMRDAEGRDETVHLAVLEESLRKGRVPADDLIAEYESGWNGSLEPIYAATDLVAA
jgi:glutamate--cysteine ligase